MSQLDRCGICTKKEMTGAIFGMRFRSSLESQRVVEGPMTCDECQRDIMAILKHVDIASILKVYKEEKKDAPSSSSTGSP